MKDAGFAHMGVGVAKGAGKAENAAKAAISSPLLETSIAGARGVIINITSSPDIGLDDVETAASMLTQSAHPDAVSYPHLSVHGPRCRPGRTAAGQNG